MERHKGNGKRSLLDKVILGVVVAIALVVIALSFSNTALLARELGLNEYLTAGLVEILFASLLFIRGRQRATQRNVPFFLTIGYFTSLAFVTGVNMYGLYQQSPTVGPIVGGAISAAMWLMESTLVWLWTESRRPHKKSAKELEREAKREIEEIKLLQRVSWMKWEAQKPSLDLIRKARKADEKRKEVVGDGLPVFFASGNTTTTNTSESTRYITSEDIITTRKEGGGINNTNYINESTSTIGEVATSEDTARGIITTNITTSNNTSSTTNGGVSTIRSTARSGDATLDTRNDTCERTTGYISENTTTRDENTNEDTSTRNITTSASKTTSGASTSKVASTRNTTGGIATTSAKRKTGGHLQLVDTDLEQVKKIALEIYEKEGKLPGRPRLRKEAQCRENQARRVLAELKEQLEAI